MLKSNTGLVGRKSMIATAVLSALTIMPTAAISAEVTNKESQIEVVTITAQKRVQNILKVPVSVGTVSEDAIEESGSVILSDLDKFIPGFDFSDGNMTQAGVTMRGISSPNISVGGDPSSATFFDDVYMPRAAQNVMFSDVQRIEVLKGPQGTLFGRNAATGVVNIVPKAPIEDNEGFTKASIGTDNLVRLEGMANVALSDSVFIRANILSTKQDGFIKNASNPSWNNDSKIWDAGARDHQAARVVVKWQLSDQTDLQFAYDWDDLEQAPPLAVGTSEYAYDGGNDIFADTLENDVRGGVEARDMSAFTVKLNHEFDAQWSMKYVASYRQWETENREDEDGTAQIDRYFDTSNNEDSDIFYTELQANYVGDNLDLVTGFSYSKEKVKQTTELNLTADSAARLITGGLNDFIRGQVAQQVTGQMADLGITSEDAQNQFIDYAVEQSGLKLDHLWNADQWSHALNALGFADQIIGGLAQAGMVPQGTPLNADLVRATGNVTYDMVAAQLGMGEIFGPGNSGKFWHESINNTGDFTNWGIYVDADYAISDKWHVIGGLRYSNDKKDFSWFIPQVEFDLARDLPLGQAPANNVLFPQVTLATSDSWDQVTGRLVTSYQMTDQDMFFASYSTGYKSGGFDSLVPLTESFSPEETSNLEFGYKGILADSVVANVSAYYMQVTDLQNTVNSLTPEEKANGQPAGKPRIINVDKDITGLELDLRWAVNDSLTLGFMTEIRSTDTDNPAYYNGEATLVEAQKTSIRAAQNMTLTFDYAPEIDTGSLNLHMDYVYRENTNAEQVGLESYKLAVKDYFTNYKNLSGRLSWTDDNERYEIGLWAHNITDNRYVNSVGGLAADALGTPYARITRGREVGLDFKINF